MQEANPLTAELSQFRASHVPKRETFAGIDWEYLVSVGGTETLLLLPGVPGLGELAFQHIARFEQSYRVISPSYPDGVTTVAQLLDGLLAILKAESCEAAYVLGGSYSGMLAQCLLHEHPERLKKVILDHTGPPSRQRAWAYRLAYALLKVLPMAGIRALFRLVNRLFPMQPATQKAFWGSYFAEVIATLTKKDYLSRLRVGHDFNQNYRSLLNEPCSWRGPLLIIEADNDLFVSAKARAALKACYPQAQVYTFQQTGHSAWATEFETFFSVIATFLQED